MAKAKKPRTIQIVKCGLCNRPLAKGESRHSHMDDVHADIFKVETYYVSDEKL